MSEPKLKRLGVCARCGFCCGADGAPEQDSPWPDKWPMDLRTWREQDLPPILHLTSTPFHGGAVAGQVLVGENICHWIWVPDHGLCKDREPFGDIGTYSEECPFLLPDRGGGQRPCAFVGTDLEFVWEAMCKRSPRLEATEKQVAAWRRRHPRCGYRWT